MAIEDDETLDDSTVILNELYVSYVRSGFTKKQAMQLIEVHLRKILDDYKETPE